MKRYNHLFAQIVSMENLKLADQRARRRKQHTHGVKSHDKHREEHLQALQQALIHKTYCTSPYDVEPIFERKRRTLYKLPYYPDRIVHHALMNVLEPLWKRTLTHNTYSCIKGRGIEACAKRVDSIIRSFAEQPLYCLKIDICKFYPSINHTILKQIVRRKIKDKDALWLIDEIIDSAVMDYEGNPLTPEALATLHPDDAHGLPIGNHPSAYMANLYLSYFMHYANEQLGIEVKEALSLNQLPQVPCTAYADDIVFFANSKPVLHEVLRLTRSYLDTKLRLRIKPNYQIFPIAHNQFDRHGRALDYVGYKFYRTHRLMRKRIKQALCRRVAQLHHRLRALPHRTMHQIVAPWLGWAMHSQSLHLIKTLQLTF